MGAVIGTKAKERRNRELRNVLETHRRELEQEIVDKLRGARNDSSHDHQVLDDGESCEVHVQAEIGFAVLRIKMETLKAVDAAVRRLGDGIYGRCVDCDDEIHEARLRALPFAVRCRDCEESREIAGGLLASPRDSARFAGLFA